MRRDELRQLFRGPIATVPTPFDDDLEVDFGRMAELTEWWVENGLVTGKAVIKVAAVGGEGDKLRESEWQYLMRTVVQASKGKATVMGAIHHKDTLRTIEDAKRAQDAGIVGLQISPPIFNAPDQDGILSFYEALSDAIDIGVLIYNTHWWPHGAIYPETFRRMVDFEQVVGIKWSPSEGYRYEDIFDLSDTFNIIDNTVQPVLNHKLGGSGYIQTALAEHPPHDLKIWELMESGSYDEAQQLFDSVVPRLREFGASTKAVMEVMGRPVGPHRPPHKSLDSKRMDELRELIISFGWPVPERAQLAAIAS